MDMNAIRLSALKRVMNERSTAEFAEAYDLNASYISQLMSGHRSFGEKAAKNMEAKIGLPAGTLSRPDIDPENPNHAQVDSSIFPVKSNNEDEIIVPQFDIRAAMGNGQLPADYVEVIKQVSLHRNHFESLGVSVTSPQNLAILTGWGQSMAGTINHGDPVFVDTGITSFVGDGVYVFTWDELVYLKRLQKVSRSEFKVISDNRENDPFTVPIAEVRINALAVMTWNAKKL